MFYGLLAMSVLISIFGIVNTLVLSVHERTREIGMLRAIGATRRQLGQMVRYESVITAVIGGVLGTLVGIAMGYVIVTHLGGDGLVFSSVAAAWACSWCSPWWWEWSRRSFRRAAPPTRACSRPSSTSRPWARRRGGPAPSPWGAGPPVEGRGGLSRPGPSRLLPGRAAREHDRLASRRQSSA